MKPLSHWSAETTLHLPVPPFVITVDAVGVDAIEDLNGVPGPLGDERRRGSGVEPPGDPGVTEVVGLACQR